MWIVEDKVSYEIIGVNIHTTVNNMHEVWATKKDGKTKLIKKSKNINEVSEIKEAIDYAIKIGDKVLELR